MSIKTFQVGALSVRVHPGQAELAVDAAQIAQRHLQEAIALKGGAAVILGSANSQIQFLEALVALGGVDWPRVTFFHMDEYLGIESTHPASFRRFMRERVEARVKPREFCYIKGEALQPLDECERYSALLKAQAIDLCCLGIGENGHIAFNDPPVADFTDRHMVKIVKLAEECRRQQVGEGHFPNPQAVPQFAYTLTIPALCAARKMLCITPEKRKARAVKEALGGPISPACPASILRQQAQCTLFLDAESASELGGTVG
ncbi:MAG: glucosamine-6-phosphate deaminase [Verrucomicrobia bacterium]|nr:glucosamine-6-phosphate deaminase [Verrucomicrobiota bacterium]